MTLSLPLPSRAKMKVSLPSAARRSRCMRRAGSGPGFDVGSTGARKELSPGHELTSRKRCGMGQNRPNQEAEPQTGHNPFKASRRRVGRSWPYRPSCNPGDAALFPGKFVFLARNGPALPCSSSCLPGKMARATAFSVCESVTYGPDPISCCRRHSAPGAPRRCGSRGRWACAYREGPPRRKVPG